MKNNYRYLRICTVLAVFVIFNIMLFKNLKEDDKATTKIKPKIILIAHVYSNPYWQYIKSGAEKAASERGAVVEFEGPDNASTEEGIKFINMAYEAKVSGIITYIQDEDKYNSVIDKVINGGIPLVTVDADAEKSNRLAYVGTDNVDAGTYAAKEVIKQIGTKGEIGIIMGGKTVKNQMERVNGFEKYIKNNSNIVISDIESSDSYLLEAQLAAKKILLNDVNIKALFCTSALDGDGAAKALVNLGLTGKVKIVCFDDLPETLDDIKKGVITSTIVQNPYYMGYKAVNIIMDNVQGKKTRGIFYTDVVVVRNENLTIYKKQLENIGKNKEN